MKLDQVVPWGRSMDEYVHMFALSESDLSSRILGCGDGPASFNAEMTAQGRTVTSVDPIYAFSATQIEARVHTTYPEIVEQARRNPQNYLWSTFADVDALGAHRLAAMYGFLADFDVGLEAGRYIVGELPALDFADRAFDLALCSHLLFLYSEQLALEFHIQAVEEMARVAAEVRIFPLLALDCRLSPHLEPTRTQLARCGYESEIVEVDYEFQRGGNQMLRIMRI